MSGPNGCGKSNISDAVRWVLGEQSAKALRGGEDGGLSSSTAPTPHKPLGMAEVSLTLADCEAALGTEYNEVTVTRRVFRSGEGQYFINKTPCRLKDIQRLFMDTGIGTNSYSLMEQGRIDQILSSRPEDRRAVFEEASGITKYKADKKEALRKLEHTEANLLRLADIIREVKRQIISLQRQAGKARRYQALQDQLRGYDIYLTRDPPRGPRGLGAEEREHPGLHPRTGGGRAAGDGRRRAGGDGNARPDRAARAAGRRDHGGRVRRAQHLGAHSGAGPGQRRAHLEMEQLSERDTRDAGEMRRRLEEHRAGAGALEQEVATATETRDAGEADLSGHAGRLSEQETRCQEVEQRLRHLRSELVDLESRSAHLQNELSQIEAQERTTLLRRERLAAEQSEMRRASKLFDGTRGPDEGPLPGTPGRGGGPGRRGRCLPDAG